MALAATALLNGVADPLAFLALPPEDFTIARAIVDVADRVALDRRQAELDYLSVSVINQLARSMRGR